mmetsp:Transcript_28365/g.74859  ORF Transcript_28365/g.74859 Transcript_28365/m.74859 type:complete len:236 (+) Transcript_28365:750-1457(+)
MELNPGDVPSNLSENGINVLQMSQDAFCVAVRVADVELISALSKSKVEYISFHHCSVGELPAGGQELVHLGVRHFKERTSTHDAKRRTQNAAEGIAVQDPEAGSQLLRVRPDFVELRRGSIDGQPRQIFGGLVENIAHIFQMCKNSLSAPVRLSAVEHVATLGETEIQHVRLLRGPSVELREQRSKFIDLVVGNFEVRIDAHHAVHHQLLLRASKVSQLLTRREEHGIEGSQGVL